LTNDATGGQIADELRRSAAYRFRVGEDDINIEDFLAHLYEIQLLLWLGQRSSLPTLLPTLTGTSRALGSLRGKLHRALRRTYALLHDACGDVSGRRVRALWQPIFAALATHQRVVPIFTLNYDWTFEKLAIENLGAYNLVDGFETMGGTWDAKRFARIAPVRGKVTIALFKLHGS